MTRLIVPSNWTQIYFRVAQNFLKEFTYTVDTIIPVKEKRFTRVEVKKFAKVHHSCLMLQIK